MWQRIRAFFRDSETIFWARLQMLIAAVVSVVATIDPSLFASYVPTGYLPIYIFVSGVVTELARRHRAEDM
jgi:hypothetical protein